MRNGRRMRASLKARLATIEMQFAFMLVDICQTELAMGDLAQAQRAVSDARVIGDEIAALVDTHGVTGAVRGKLMKLARKIQAAELALLDARTRAESGTPEFQVPAEAPGACFPAMVMTASSGT